MPDQSGTVTRQAFPFLAGWKNTTASWCRSLRHDAEAPVVRTVAGLTMKLTHVTPIRGPSTASAYYGGKRGTGLEYTLHRKQCRMGAALHFHTLSMPGSAAPTGKCLTHACASVGELLRGGRFMRAAKLANTECMHLDFKHSVTPGIKRCTAGQH
eukprot:1148278-Pelagomonas_calceolata.AAC.4